MMNKAIEKIVDAWDDYSVGVATIITIGIVVGILALWFGSVCLHAWLIMLLWNWAVVGLFGTPVISFWMAFGIHCLCSLLFKSNVTVNKKSE